MIWKNYLLEIIVFVLLNQMIKLNNKEKSDFLSFNLNNTPSKNSLNNDFNNNYISFKSKIYS